jgi:hypothetical protein
MRLLCRTFEFIRERKMFATVLDLVVPLVELNEVEAINLFMTHMDVIPIKQVATKLNDRPLTLHKYLHELFQKDCHIAADFHERQVNCP